MVAGGVYSLHLLGPVRLLDPAGKRVLISSKRGMALIVLLAMAGSGERTRAWLQEKLWSTRGEAQAQGSLRRELANLKALLAAESGNFIGSDHQRVWLERGMLRVDRTDDEEGAEFLEGFDLRGEEGFDDWLREQRFAHASEANRRIEQGATKKGADPNLRVSDSSPRALRKPSVALLMAESSAASSSSNSLAETFVDDIAVSLSRFGTLNVFPAVPIDGADRPDYRLHCRLVAGSGRIRFWVRLTGGSDDLQVWTERFDEAATDAFAVQDRLTLSVARQIDSAIEREEMRRALQGSTRRDDPHALYWRANALVRRWTRFALEEATTLCVQAAELSPSHPWPPALAGFCRGIAIASGWSGDLFTDRAQALEDAARALQLGSDEPPVLGYVAGTLLVIGGDIEQARRVIERAAALAPGYPAVPFWHGWILCCMGDPQGGLDHLSAAEAMNPRSAVRPFQQTGIGLCLVLVGRSPEAVPILEDSSHRLPDHPVTLAALAAAYFLCGRQDEAAVTGERLRRVDPSLLTLLVMRDQVLRQHWREAIDAARPNDPSPLRLVGGGAS